jgi:chaperonin cofactor prefoldin
MKHLQHTAETLAKQLKTLESHCKHMQHPYEKLATYV